jgi:hypothetical protein
MKNRIVIQKRRPCPCQGLLCVGFYDMVIKILWTPRSAGLVPGGIQGRSALRTPRYLDHQVFEGGVLKSHKPERL